MLAMVAGQPVETHNDMYCSQYDYYADYYGQQQAGGPGGPTLPPPGAQPPPPPPQQQQAPPPQQHHEMCPAAAHPPLCAVHDFHGPVTVPMVSTNSTPPIAMPVQVPPGHMVQQIVDESGTLRHVILSPQAMVTLPPAPFGLPPGFPPHFGHSNPLPTGVMAHVPPPQAGHSPPPHSFHKDERTHRQYIKLKKKLEQKHMRSESMSIGSTQSTPPVSPRRDLVNGMRRGGKDRITSGRSSVGTSEDGEESSSMQDEEEEANLVIERLSLVKSPEVTDLTSRSALLHWVQPEPPADVSMESKGAEIDLSDACLRYEVLLSDKGKEGKYKSIYNGDYLSCRIQDLRPGTVYSVCLQVHLDELTGSASEPTTFTTPPCEPDTPLPPKLVTRNRTHLLLRWTAPVDNGSHITQYVLESDEGKGGEEFVEVYKSKGKQHNLMKLQASTCYRFRLCAVNECGKSAYSDVVQFYTLGSPPTQPTAPVLKEASVTSLHLAWQKRPNDEDFTLQMDDIDSGHGFLAIYNGKEHFYIKDGLHRHTLYKFKLRASNEEGSSPWSDEVCYRTLPGRPAAPPRPSLKGRVHSQSFKVKWEPPSDRGGADITTFILERRHSGCGFEEVYRGLDTEYICDRLMPGTTYDLRVSCISAGGHSPWSDVCHITTDPVCPRQCQSPRAHGKPRANSLVLKWGYPDYDGGAPVTEFEVMMTSRDLTQRVVYKGDATECAVTDLLPGQVYVFQVRAFNKAGGGPWSESAEIMSGAAPPEVPAAPTVVCRSAYVALVQWKEPHNNGAMVTDYKLEMSLSEEEEDYEVVFHGLASSYEATKLIPAMSYYFRVQSGNSAGWSGISPCTKVTSPPAPPSVVNHLRYTATPTSLALLWNEPACNGSPILHYNIDLGGERVESSAGPELQYTIENVHPDTTYKCRVQAVNCVGSGPFSATLKAATPALPPTAPKLECVGAGHNYLKLKWGDGRNPDFTNYTIEMQTPWSKEFHCIYRGTSHTYKVHKLAELTTNRFRICATNDAGQGDWSEPVEFSTCIAIPPSLKAPRVSEIQQRSCVVEWVPCKPISSDPVQYQLQLARIRDQDYKQVYRGSETKSQLNDLEPGTEYYVRVCPIRMAASGDLLGAYSPPSHFTTVAPEHIVSHSARSSAAQNVERKPLTDAQWAFIMVIGFMLVAVLIPVIVQSLLSVEKSSYPDS